MESGRKCEPYNTQPNKTSLPAVQKLRLRWEGHLGDNILLGSDKDLRYAPRPLTKPIKYTRLL